MFLFAVTILIFVLYWRTLNYNYLIDDNVQRNGYLYEVPLTAPVAKRDDKGNIIEAQIYDRKPSKWYRLFMIGMHAVNTAIIYLLWGWAPALLFAVHPVGVWGTAWVTGNYYATTTYFCLIAYYFLHNFPNIWGCGVAMALYATALNSTIEALAFPFVLLAVGNLWGIPMLFPLYMFLTGKRFTTGMKIREGFINEKRVKGFSVNRLFLMTKVIGRYVFTMLYPDRLGFFGPFGANIHDNQQKYDDMHAPNKEFWQNLALCLVFFALGMMVSPFATMWFFGFVVLHSQWKIMGQFFAVRYLYIAIVGSCVILGSVLQSYPVVLACLVTYYLVRTHVHIFAFRNMNAIWQNDFDTWPEHAQCWNNLAQSFMRENQQGVSLPSWKINLMAAYILRAQEMDPKAWEINMNVACFYAIIGQWPMCLKFTDIAIDCLREVADKPGGPLVQLLAQRERIINMANQAVNQPEGVKDDEKKGSAVEPGGDPGVQGREIGAGVSAS